MMAKDTFFLAVVTTSFRPLNEALLLPRSLGYLTLSERFVRSVFGNPRFVCTMQRDGLWASFIWEEYKHAQRVFVRDKGKDFLLYFFLFFSVSL